MLTFTELEKLLWSSKIVTLVPNNFVIDSVQHVV